jgi:hypothetical protein
MTKAGTYQFLEGYTKSDLIRFADPYAAEVHRGVPHEPQGEYSG